MPASRSEAVLMMESNHSSCAFGLIIHCTVMSKNGKTGFTANQLVQKSRNP